MADLAPVPSEAEIREALRDVIDPEIGINVVDLGLVYGVEAEPGRVRVRLTMTTPACPLGDHLSAETRRAIMAHFDGIDAVEVELVFDPPWEPEMMTERAKQQFGWG
jgi:metal-sulfur cluster biosynthetic enzyme